MIVNAESEGELDDVITRLPIWPRMETEVTPLTTFEGRALALRPRLEQLKADVQRAAGESAG
jgi:muconolactone delta-isomerase